MRNCIAIPFALALTRPLRRLRDRLIAMVDGDLDSVISGGARSDEIGGSAHAMHIVRDRLGAMEAAFATRPRRCGCLARACMPLRKAT